MKEALLKIKNILSQAVQSDWFIVLNALIVVLGWSLKVWVPMLCVMAAINIVPLFFDRHVKHLFNLLMMYSFIICTPRGSFDRYTPVLAIVLALLVAVLFNLIFFRRKLSPLHPKDLKGFHASLLALIFPFAFAGITSPAEHPLLSVAILLLALVVCAVYSFFTVAFYDSDDKAALPQYVLKILVASGLVLTLEMLIFYGKIGDVNKIVQAMISKNMDLGWAQPNNVAPMLSMCIPATLYFCIRKNFATPVLTSLALVEYALIIFSGCRGAIILTTIALPAILMYVIVKSDNKVSFGVTVSLFFFIAVLLVAYYGEIFAHILSAILNRGLDPSDRDVLYRLAVDTFKTWPIFGAGWDYNTRYFFQSTFFQALATMGLFGLILLIVFYLWRYWTFFRMRKDPATLALFTGLIIFDAYGMLSNNFFLPHFFIILLVMTLAVEVNLPHNLCLAFGGKDPVAHVVGFFRILLDKVKPPKSSSDSSTDATAPPTQMSRPAQSGKPKSQASSTSQSVTEAQNSASNDNPQAQKPTSLAPQSDDAVATPPEVSGPRPKK